MEDKLWVFSTFHYLKPQYIKLLTNVIRYANGTRKKPIGHFPLSS
jgi:hypothetical protein